MNLQLSLKTQWFEMTKAGIKLEDYREVNDYWIKRLVSSVTFFGGRYESLKNVSIKECSVHRINLIGKCPTVLNRDLTFKSFDYNIMTLGYPSKTDTARILKFKHEGIEIRTGNPEWGAEPNKLYFVVKHGEVVK